MSRRGSSSSNDIKYPPGVGARIPPHQRPLRPLEWAVLIHVGIFLVATTWAFGGAAQWVRTPLAWWGSLGLLLTLTALQDREALRQGWFRPLWWLWPWIAFNLFVVAGALNPSFREIKFGAETLLGNEGGRPGLPSSARPMLGIQALWMFDAIWISCFNLALVIRQRSALRGLIVLAVVNAFVLAVFGTVQRLAHAKGLFFGAVDSPRQSYFFASFVYHNHWGAFIVLMMAACLGLVWHVGRRRESRDFFHSPAFGGLIVIFFLALTVPLSSSRSCTLLVAALLSVTLLHWTTRLVRKRRRFKESVVLPLAGTLAALILAGAGVWYVARESIDVRLDLTKSQLSAMRARGGIGSRADLYHDTWTMAQAKPWFGWGMGSYPHVFTLYNTQKSVDKFPIFYHDAHSDWLQALAEHGFVGTLLLGLCGLVPLLKLRLRHLDDPLLCYLLVGCGFVLLYAWVEFPFGNIAVVLSWWLCFFTAIHYGRLSDRETMALAKPAPTSIRPTPATS